MPADATPVVEPAALLGVPTLTDAPPLRVLHLLTTLDRGGTERLVLRLAVEQRALGCHVEVAVLTPLVPLAPEFTRAGVAVHQIGMRRKLSLGGFLRLRRLLRNGRYDVLHTHLDLADLYGPFAAGGTPLVVSSRHNTDSWRVRRSWKRFPFLLWERAAHRRAAAAIAVSAAVRDFLVQEEGLEAGRFVVIPNGIDLRPFSSLPPRPVALSHLKEVLTAATADRKEAILGLGKRPIVGFVGRLAAQKGVDLLVQAASLPGADFDLVLIGDGPLAAKLRAAAEKLGVAPRVFFAGEQEPVAGLLPAFDIFAFPSRWEGFGLAAVEAMAAARPVVAAASDGLREVIEDGISGRLVTPGSAAALAAGLAALIDDPPAAARLGAAARARALARYDATRMAAAVTDLYRRLLRSESRSLAVGTTAAGGPESRP